MTCILSQRKKKFKFPHLGTSIWGPVSAQRWGPTASGCCPSPLHRQHWWGTQGPSRTGLTPDWASPPLPAHICGSPLRRSSSFLSQNSESTGRLCTAPDCQTWFQSFRITRVPVGKMTRRAGTSARHNRGLSPILHALPLWRGLVAPASPEQESSEKHEAVSSSSLSPSLLPQHRGSAPHSQTRQVPELSVVPQT